MFWFKKILTPILAINFVVLVSFVLLPSLLESTYVAPVVVREQSQVAAVQAILVSHLATPEPLKAIYMTACVAAESGWRDNFQKLIEETELNAVVIDIKDYTGVVSIPNEFPKTDTHRGCIVEDMQEFIRTLHQSGIYVIGRVSVFQDPSYTKLFPELAVKKKSDGEVWKDYKGLSFIDVGATPYWDYIVALSKEAYGIGFDEINYDYVRYPSDGNMRDTKYTWMVGTTTKLEMLKNFFEYLYNNLKDTGAKLSVDLFGMTTTVEHDMNIGQVLELALPYFDYVSPMVYPSHYPFTWNGFANPAEHPYEVVKIAMLSAVKREMVWNLLQGLASTTPSKMRPWLQDFNLGATYGPDKVQAQIKATYDVGLNSWMLWSASNQYTKEALLLE